MSELLAPASEQSAGERTELFGVRGATRDIKVKVTILQPLPIYPFHFSFSASYVIFIFILVLDHLLIDILFISKKNYIRSLCKFP